jgi:tRNA(Ile)-lysidine synthase
MLATIHRTIADHELTRPGDRVLVAVSGGPDSVAMLVALSRLAGRLGIALRAATVDHGLRPEAAGEARAVVQLCGGLGIACDVLAVDVRGHQGRHVSLQDAARRARATALAGAAARLGCQRVALGHTADDQAETVLFRIVRGTGLAGLAGIPYRRDLFIRPLLDVRREEILRFLRRRRIGFVDDPSNRDPRFTRSRVRAQWLPFLARENPRIVQALLGLAAESRARAGRPAAPAAAGPGRAAAARIAQLAARGAGTRWVSFAGGRAEVAYGQVRLTGPAGPAAAPRAPACLSIPGPGVYRWPEGEDGWTIEVKRVSGPPPAEVPLPPVGAFDPACLEGGLAVRGWQPGDRMRPRGARGTRKLQDLFVDRKLPRALRRQIPLLLGSDGTILYMPGFRPSERHRPDPDSREWVSILVTGPGAHLSCSKADSAAARVDDLSLDDNTFSLGGGYAPRTP